MFYENVHWLNAQEPVAYYVLPTTLIKKNIVSFNPSHAVPIYKPDQLP
jgi:hypothetical protein